MQYMLKEIYFSNRTVKASDHIHLRICGNGRPLTAPERIHEIHRLRHLGWSFRFFDGVSIYFRRKNKLHTVIKRR